MCRTNPSSALLATAIIFLAATVAPADVTFYLQREGSPEDDGLALFIETIDETVGEYVEQDFEDPALGGDGTEISAFPVGDFQLELAAGDSFAPMLFYSSEFNVEGKLYHLTLAADSFLTLTPAPDQRVLALGTWIFDDGRAFDSAYHVEVTESNGDTWETVLENEIGLDHYNHEIEGFIGMVSDVGIAQLTITAVDPETGEANPDPLEIDHLIIAGDPFIPAEREVEALDGDYSRWRRKRGHFPHHHPRHLPRDKAQRPDGPPVPERAGLDGIRRPHPACSQVDPIHKLRRATGRHRPLSPAQAVAPPPRAD